MKEKLTPAQWRAFGQSFGLGFCLAFGMFIAWLAVQLDVDWWKPASLLYGLCAAAFIVLILEKPRGR